jgi:hypothetical protein
LGFISQNHQKSEFSVRAESVIFLLRALRARRSGWERCQDSILASHECVKCYQLFEYISTRHTRTVFKIFYLSHILFWKNYKFERFGVPCGLLFLGVLQSSAGVEFEENYVAVFYHVVSALLPVLPSSLGTKNMKSFSKLSFFSINQIEGIVY